MREVYLGTKILTAQAMTLGEFNEAHGVKGSHIEMPLSTKGFEVEYEDGYISWSPTKAFEPYKKNGELNFGHALLLLKRGHSMRRAGWNGKGMFVVYMPSLYLSADKVSDSTRKWVGEGRPLSCNSYLAMQTADQKWQPGWVPSQADMMAEDWEIVK